MHLYFASQWILFFFLYSFMGWVWESCYVSLKERRLVNRGFMHGPFLPLYGSGAVIVLFCTMTVQDHVVLVFLLGMAGATALEFVTGVVMESIFHVKYWDYSHQKLNLKGYICPAASLCWGCFSVLMVYVVHPPVQSAVLMLPERAAAAAAAVLTVGTAADFILSFREALDMKQLLAQVEKTRQQFRRLQDKLYQAAGGMTVMDKVHLDKRMEKKLFGRAAYLEKIRTGRRMRAKQLEELSAKIETVIKGSLPPKLSGRAAEKWRQDLAEIKENIFREFQKMNERSDRRYLHIAQMLRRNPTAVSGKFKETLDELKKIINGKQ